MFTIPKAMEVSPGYKQQRAKPVRMGTGAKVAVTTSLDGRGGGCMQQP